MRVVIALTFVFVFAANASDDSRECYDAEKDFHPLLGTRTAYELVRGHKNMRASTDPTCKPLQVWVLLRHGTKYPENKNMPRLLNITTFRDQILDNHKHGEGHLCDKDLENFRNWKFDPDINEETDEGLTAQGEKDQFDFAQRLQKAFPELLSPETLGPKDLLFTSTNRPRTLDSVKAFQKGIFGDDIDRPEIVKTIVPEDDRLLLAYSNCKAWIEGYDDKDPNTQRRKFQKGPEVKAVLADLTRRLGFQYGIKYKTMKTVFDVCRYEVAWHPEKVSTWCSVFFTKENLKVFEYIEDLESYYCCGPGRDMTAKIGCEPIVDMFTRFKALEAGDVENQPKGIVYFGHTMSLLTTITALNIGQEDNPITYLNYAEKQNRTFHVSNLDPFTTNIVAVFYKCSGSGPKHRVSLHMSEEPIPHDECPNGLCDWEFVKRQYGPIADNCNMDFCDNA